MNLHEAVIKGEAATVRSLLKGGEDPNIRSPEGLMILQHENAWKDCDITIRLLKHGADMGDLSSEGFPGVYYAIKYSDYRASRMIAICGQNYADQVLAGGNTLMHLIAGGEIFKDTGVGAMEVLHHGGVDLYARNDEGLTALEIAEEGGNRACIEFLQEHARWEFTDAVSRNDITKIKKMIADGVNMKPLDKPKTPALFLALVSYPGTEMFKLLLEHGADPNVKIEGLPLLHYVATHSDIVNKRDDVTRPKELLELMWDAGADFWILDKFGEDAIRAVSTSRGSDYILKQAAEIAELLRDYQRRQSKRVRVSN